MAEASRNCTGRGRRWKPSSRESATPSTRFCAGQNTTASAPMPPRGRLRWPGSARPLLLALDLVRLLASSHTSSAFARADVSAPDLAHIRQHLRRVHVELDLDETRSDQRRAVLVDGDGARDAAGPRIEPLLDLRAQGFELHHVRDGQAAAGP